MKDWTEEQREVIKNHVQLFHPNSKIEWEDGIIKVSNVKLTKEQTEFIGLYALANKKAIEGFNYESYFLSAPSKITLITEERRKLFQSNGNDCGFPQCCIDFFCTVHPSDRPEGYSFYNGKFNSSGFIACPDHKQQILAGKTTLSDLIDYSKRKPSLGKFKESWGSYGE